jgi:hypothetical protein
MSEVMSGLPLMARASTDDVSTPARQTRSRSRTTRARLWRDQPKRDEAHDLLAPVYGWFTEGFDTIHLKEAKALLEAAGVMSMRENRGQGDFKSSPFLVDSRSISSFLIRPTRISNDALKRECRQHWAKRQRRNCRFYGLRWEKLCRRFPSCVFRPQTVG